MGKYLRSLLDLGFIRRIISLDAPDRSNTRLSRYEIKDSYLRFFFSFIYPNIELLEQHRYTRLMEIIKENYSAYVGRTGFEELARRHIGQMGDRHELSFIPESVGRIWSRSAEVDVAAIDRKSCNILLGECKWTGKKMDLHVLDRLIEKSKSFIRIKGYKNHFALFSKSGFTSSLQKRAKAESILIFGGPDFKAG
jgi:AAA+ ATPase superfamily predicted ATPase